MEAPNTGLPKPSQIANRCREEQLPGVAKPIRMTGAEAIVQTLENLGVTELFGLPGGAILPTFDPLYSAKKLRHILVRHEQCAGHAAEGYAISSGKVGVALVTSGPGATNILTALADANMDSVPMLVISGQVAASAIGTDAFQEADIVGASLPITKHNYLVTDGADIPRILAEAYYIANSGRKGPVLVDITKSAQTQEIEFSWPPVMDIPGYRVAGKPHIGQIKMAAEMLLEAERPVLYVGGGAIASGAHAELEELAELTNAPVTLTLMAQGAYPASARRNLGMPGMHGTVPAVTAMQRCDLLVALGARFDDRVTGKMDAFAPQAKVIHIDIDPAEISKNRFADVPIVGDLKEALQLLNQEIRSLHAQGKENDISGWWNHLDYISKRFPLHYDEPKDGMLAAQYVIKRLGELVGTDAIYCAGVGQHQMWAQQFLQTEKPRHFMTSAGLGTMGVAVPEAMGAKVANPDKVVWAVDGDGCFQMTNQELATCVHNNIPIKVAIINNSVLGMVHQWQTLFYGERYSNTDLYDGEGSIEVPNFVKLAEAYGALGLRARTVEEVDQVIKQAMETNDRPVVIDFRVSTDCQVWPMVPAGESNDRIRYSATSGPVWDSQD